MPNKSIKGIGHVFYPESCPIDNVLEHILDKYNCCISPVHDRDLTRDGILKKKHYHILFQGKLSAKDKRYISSITTMNYFEDLYDLRASYDYLYHWKTSDNWFIKGKAQYWKADIIYSERWSDLPNDDVKEDFFRRMVDDMSLCCEFSDFINFLSDIDDIPYREYCLKNVHLIDRYIISNKFKNRNQKSGIPINQLKTEEWQDSTKVHNMQNAELMDLRTYVNTKFQDIENKIDFPIDIL